MAETATPFAPSSFHIKGPLQPSTSPLMSSRHRPNSPPLSHVRKSSLTIFNIAASAGGKDLAPHSLISPPRAAAEFKRPPPAQNKEGQEQPLSPSSSSRRFSFGFGVGNKGPAAGPSSSWPAPAEVRQRELPQSSSTTDSSAATPNPLGTETVRCHVLADDDVLLPFLERAAEVKDLLFNTPTNSHIATRLRTWASLRGSIGDDLLHTLTNVDRSERDDARWVATIRSVLIKEVPDLWADLALTLGADGSTFAPPDSQVKSFDHPDPYEDHAVDDESDISSVATLSQQGGHNKRQSQSLSGFSSVSFVESDRPAEDAAPSQETSGLEVEGLHFLPENYNKAISQLQGPCYPSDGEQEVHGNSEEQLQLDASTSVAQKFTRNNSAGRPNFFPSTSGGESVEETSSGPPRACGMSKSLSAQQSYLQSENDAKTESQTFAGLRLRSNSMFDKEDGDDYLTGFLEGSPRARRRAARSGNKEAKPLIVKHNRRLSDLFGSEPDPPPQRQKCPTAVPLPSQPQAREASPIESNKKMLSSLRPTAATPSLDDEELLHPQRSKFSFARDFEGPTPSDPRHHSRPKAYSMTQYSSHVEQNRLEAGKIASITPYEAAAAYEAEGVEKPADLGVLKDGRTRHPSSGKTESASVVAAFRSSLGLSPGTSSLSPINSNPSSGKGSPSGGGSGAVTPINKERRSSHADQGRASHDDAQVGPIQPTHLAENKSGQDGEGSSKSRDKSASIQAALSSPPHIHRRPGGFDSFSAELEALQQQRVRARSDAAFSSGSHAVASSSEGSTLSDLGASSVLDEEDDEAKHGGMVPAAPSSLRGVVSVGDFGMDFGDQQQENVAERFSQPAEKAPSTPPTKTQDFASPISPQVVSSSSFHSPRSARGDDHIIIPIPPGGPRSRAQAMSALWGRPDIQYLVERMEDAISQARWGDALNIMCTVERDTVSDRALLERLARECFLLLDLNSDDPMEAEKAERLMCNDGGQEDPAEYEKRWKAFEMLLSDGLCVPSSSLQEAKRRCALHL